MRPGVKDSGTRERRETLAIGCSRMAGGEPRPMPMGTRMGSWMEALAPEVSNGGTWLGYSMRDVRCGQTLELTISREGEEFTIWVMPRQRDTAFYRETKSYRVGYRCESPAADALRVLDIFCTRLAAMEEHLVSLDPPSAACHATQPQGDLAISRGVLELRVTLECNERCVFCNVDEEAENVLTDAARVEEAIRAAPAMGVHRITFTGGEPTLRKELPAWVAWCHGLGLDVMVQTNGLVPAAAPYWERFRSPDGGFLLPHQLYVSFHTARPGRLAAITGRGNTFERKVRAIHNARRLGMAVGLNFVVNTLNLDELEEFPGFVARTFGPDIPIEISIVAPTGKARQRLDLIPAYSEIAPVLKRAIESARGLSLDMKVLEVCGMPPCVLPSEARSFRTVEAPPMDGPISPDRVKGPCCDECVFHARCLGVWTLYAERHGIGELSPFRREPPCACGV